LLFNLINLGGKKKMNTGNNLGQFSHGSSRKKVGWKSSMAAYSMVFGVCSIAFINPACADWFKVADIKTNLITPVYTLINDNLGFVAFAVGGATTFLARGQDMYQKALAFGVGSLGTAGAVKLAQTVLHLG
jgi:hypothetical protein